MNTRKKNFHNPRTHSQLSRNFKHSRHPKMIIILLNRVLQLPRIGTPFRIVPKLFIHISRIPYRKKKNKTTLRYRYMPSPFRNGANRYFGGAGCFFNKRTHIRTLFSFSGVKILGMDAPMMSFGMWTVRTPRRPLPQMFPWASCEMRSEVIHCVWVGSAGKVEISRYI